MIQYVLSIVDYYKIIGSVFCILVVAIIIYLRGTKRNLEIVQGYMKVISPTLKTLFPKFEDRIIQESPNVLKVYAEGRKSCIFAILGFAMISRQQMLSFLLNDVLFRRKDQLVIEIPIKNENPPLFSCAIFKNKYLKNITKKKYPDLKGFCKEHHTALPKNLTVIAESKELLSLIVNEKTIPLWSQNSQIVKFFYMSDSNRLSKYGFCVRLVLELKPNSAPRLIGLLQMLVAIVDKLSTVKMSQNTRNHIIRNRNEASL